MPARQGSTRTKHIWDIESGRYSWPTPSERRIYRTFTPIDLEPEFDVVAVFANHLRLVTSVADRHPDVTFVVEALPIGTGRTCCDL